MERVLQYTHLPQEPASVADGAPTPPECARNPFVRLRSLKRTTQERHGPCSPMFQAVDWGSSDTAGCMNRSWPVWMQEQLRAQGLYCGHEFSAQPG